MADNGYFGRYGRFETVSKKDLGSLLSADNQVGDVFEVVFISEGSVRKAWMKNRFGNLIGFFDEQTTHQLSLCEAREWEIRSLLSFVALTENPEPGFCWGEAALICFEKKHSDAFDAFVEGVSKKLANGVRPDIDLGEIGVTSVLESQGSWLPSRTIPLPEKKSGTVIMKYDRRISEKMIDKAREGNNGCLIVGWAFIAVIILVIVLVVLFALRSYSLI